MATADQYAAWIVANKDKQGTPDFETVANAYKAAKAEEMPAPKQADPSLLGEAYKGLQQFASQSRTALGGGSAESALAGLERGKAIDAERKSGVDLEKIKDLWNAGNYGSSALEYVKQAPYAIAGQIPQLATAAGGASLGARLGALGGLPGSLAGAGIGALAGQALSSYLPIAGSNIESQAAEQQKQGLPIDINRLAAYGTAVPQVGLEVISQRLLLGNKMLGKAFGFTEEQLAKKSVAELEKLAAEKLYATVGKGVLKGGLAEIPTEVTQTMLERAQAGLSITDAEARTAYGDTALQVGMIAPLGGYTRYRERGSAQQYQEKQAQAESAKKFQADQAAETARLQSPAYLEQLSTDYKAAVAEKKRLDEVATAAKEAAKSGDPSARATAAEALKAARKYEAETLTPLARQHAPRSAEIQKLEETKRVAGMSPFDYMMEQSGVPTQEIQAPPPPPKEQQLYPGDEPVPKTPPPLPAHEAYAAQQMDRASQWDFGTNDESTYVKLLMEYPAMARELVTNKTAIPGLTRKQNSAVLGAMKLQLAEQDKAQTEHEERLKEAELSRQVTTVPGEPSGASAVQRETTTRRETRDEQARNATGVGDIDLDFLNDLTGEALGKGSGEVAVEPPAGVQPSAKAPDVLGRIDTLTNQRDQAAKDADLNFRSGNSTAGREALAKQKTAEDALALAQSEDAAPYVQELVGQRNTQQTSLLDLESAVDDLINGRYLNKLDVGVSASRQIGLASSTKQGLLDKIKAAKKAYINSVLLESATKRRALGKENLSTDEALRAASDISATLNEWVTRGLANPRHAALQEQVVQQAQMRGNKLVRGAITKMVEPTDTRPPEERRFGAYRQAVEVLKEQLEGARNKLFAVPERGVREQPVLRTQFAAEEAAKTGAERGEGAATLGGELRRRREAAADKVSKALARPDVPEDIRAALDSALTALEQGRGSKDVTSAEPTQQFAPGLIDAAEELATRILEGRVTPAGATASTGDVRRVEALEDTIDKLMAVQRNAKSEDAQAAAADKVKRVKAMLVTLKAKQPAAAAPTTTGAAERNLIGQINEALRGQGLTEEPAEQMSLFGPEAQQAPERMRRTLPARIEEERGKKTTSFQELGEQRTKLKALEGQLSSAEEAAEQARGLRAIQDRLDRGLGFIRKTAENFAKAPAVQRARMLVQQARDLTAKIKAEFDKRDAVQTRLLAHRAEVKKNLDILAAKLSHFDWVGTAFGETGVEPYTPTAPSKPIDTASDAVKAKYEKALAQYPKDVAFAKEFNAFWAKEAAERKVYREYFNNQKKALLAEQGKLVNFLRPLSDSVADDVRSQIDAKEKTVEALRKQLAGRNNLDEFRTLTTQLNTFSADLAKLKKRLEAPAVATGKAATAELNSFLQTQRSHLYVAYNQALDKARGDLTATRRAAAAPTIAAAEARIAETETELAALVAELNKKVTEYAAEQQKTYGQTETTSAQQELSKSVAALETSVAAAQATAQENIDKAKAEIAKARETSEATVLMEEISATALADRAVDTQRKALAKAVKQLEDLGFEVNLDRATVKLANKTDPIAQAQLVTKVAELKRAEAAQASVRAERQAAEQRLKVGATQGLGLPGTRTVTNENAVAVKERFERAIVRLEADLAKAIADREAAKTRQQKAGFTKRITSLKNEIAGNQAQMALVKTSRTETILEEKEAAADQQLADATTQAQYTAEAQARNAKNEQDIERLSKYIPVLETELARLEAQGVLAGKAGDAQRARIAQIKKRITDLNFTLEARLDTRIKHRKQRPVVVKTGVSNEPLRGGAYTKTVEEQRNPGESYEEARQRYDRTAAMLAAVAEADRIRGYPVGAKLTPEQKAKFDKARESALAAGKQQRLQDEKDAKKAAKEDEALERELIGRGGVDEFLFSRGVVRNPSTKAEVEAELEKAFGDQLFGLEEQFGQVNRAIRVYQTVAAFIKDNPTYRNKIPVDAKGLVKDSHAVLFAENLEKGEALGVMLHEVGVHIGFRNFFNIAQFNALVKTVKGWAARNDGSLEERIGKAALQRVKEAQTKASQIDDEILAYAVEEAVKAGVQPTGTVGSSALKNWLNMIVTAFKKALTTLGLNSEKLKAGDLVNFAYGCAQLELRGTWHGSDALFTAFDRRMAGAGEGSFVELESLGKGPYATPDKALGETYQHAIPFGKAANKTGYGNKSYQDLRDYASKNSDNESVIAYQNRYELALLSTYLSSIWHGGALNPVENSKLQTFVNENLSLVKAKIATLENLLVKEKATRKSAFEISAIERNLTRERKKLKAAETTDVSKLQGLTERPQKGHLYRTLDDIPHHRVLVVSSRMTFGERPKVDALAEKYGHLTGPKNKNGSEGKRKDYYDGNDLFYSMRKTLGIDKTTELLKAADIDAIELLSGNETHYERAYIDEVPEILGTDLEPIGPAEGILLSRAAAPTYAPNLKEAGELAERMVGRQKTTTQKIKANLAGLAFRTQFVDALAPLEKIAFGAMDALKGMQMMYYLRAYGQRNNYTSKAMSQGVPQLVEVKRADGRIERKFVSSEGATLKDVVDILTTVKGVSPDAANRLFTLYMSAIRAKRVGIDALNFSGNITEADLDAAMQQIKAAGLEEPFERARSKYNEYNENLLKFNIQTGYISKALGAELTAQKDYIPFYRVRNGNVELLIGKETPVRIGDLKSNPHLKELVGGEEPIFDFLTSSVQNTSMLMDAALRNMAVKNAMFELNEIKVNGENAVRISKGEGPKGTVGFFLEGEEHYAVVNTEETLGIPSDLLVRGLEGIPTMLPTAVRLMGIPARLLRRTIVASPVYMARQLFRDSLAATMTSGVDGMPVLNALRQIGKSHPLDKSGVTGGQVFTGTSEDMSRLLAEMQSGKSGWTQALSKLEAMSMEVDAAGRRAQYNSYIQQGLSEMEAEYMALDSMNFSKRGISPSMHYLSTLIPFFNAQIQGLDVLYKAFTGKMPMDEKLKIQEKLFARGAMLAGMTLAYAAAMQDDEGYKNATPEQKYGNWFVYVPGVKEAVRVPIPFELGYVFKAIPEAIVNMVMNKDGAEEAQKAFKQIALQIIPGGTSWAIPQAVKPLIEVGLGKSFYTGQDLETAKEQRLDPGMRYRDNTSEAAKFVGQMLNISPIKMEALINGYTGSMGLALLQALNFAMPATGPEAAFKRLSEQPVIGPLFQPTDAGGIINATYDRVEEINRAKASYEKLLAENQPAQAQAYLKEHITELSLASVAGSFSKQMGELTKYEAEIKASSRTPEKKREELDRIRQLKIKFATSVRAAFDRKELQAVPA